MMIRTRWIKIFIDLWSNRWRTLVVAMAIAVGVYSIGFIMDIQELLVREDQLDRQQALSASAIINTTPFDSQLAERVAEIPGIAAAEGRSSVLTFLYDEDGTRLNLEITAVPDFNDMQVDRLTYLEGSWPPAKNEIVLERLAIDYLGTSIGERLALELEDGTKKFVTVSSVAHDSQQFNPDITGTATGYVTPATMGSLGFGELFTSLRVRVEPAGPGIILEDAAEEARVEQIVQRAEDHLERTHRPVFRSTSQFERPQDSIMETVVLILSTFGFIILLLSGFLVVNAISALITQQVQQIGIMKLVGGGRWQIMSMYMVTVLVYGGIAILIGIPLSILTAQLIMTHLVSGLLNVMPDSLNVPYSLIAIQTGIGLLMPLLAGLIPVVKGTRITTHQALNDSGMKANVHGQGVTERMLAWLQSLRPIRRSYLLSIRNTLRHKGRLVQTLAVLIIGTALFISVISVNSSVKATLDTFLKYHQYDVSLGMARPYRIGQLERTATQLPGVASVESWTQSGATRTRPDGSESNPFRLYAIPTGSDLIDPQLAAGRWLASGERNGVVINSDVADKEGDLQVGGSITLDLAGREMVGQVVGIVRTDSHGPAVYMNHDAYAYHTRTPNQATHVQVVADQHDSASQELLTQQLLAAVGGLGLTTTMSINMLERIREIGVLRAIGASNVSVRQVVLAEGIVIGLISWLLGTLLSIPISVFLSEQIGLALLKVPLNYQYSLATAVAWFFAILLIATAASLGPSRNAVRLTIREVLAYE